MKGCRGAEQHGKCGRTVISLEWICGMGLRRVARDEDALGQLMKSVVLMRPWF